jgi:hypothetical protein
VHVGEYETFKDRYVQSVTSRRTPAGVSEEP